MVVGDAMSMTGMGTTLRVNETARRAIGWVLTALIVLLLMAVAVNWLFMPDNPDTRRNTPSMPGR